MSTVLSGTLMVVFLVTLWRVTWFSSPARGRLMMCVLLLLAGSILTLLAEISRLSAVVS